MADSIDKSVVDTKTTVELPGAEEVIQDQQEKIEKVQSEGGPVEIEMDDQGGAEISFDPNAATPEGGEEHFANLCLLYTSPSPRDGLLSRMPSSA